MRAIIDLLSSVKDGNESDTFTRDEVRALIDWHVSNIMDTELCQQRLQAEQQRGEQIAQKARDTLDTLMGLWDASASAPALKVVVDDGTL